MSGVVAWLVSWGYEQALWQIVLLLITVCFVGYKVVNILYLRAYYAGYDRGREEGECRERERILERLKNPYTLAELVTPDNSEKILARAAKVMISRCGINVLDVLSVASDAMRSALWQQNDASDYAREQLRMLREAESSRAALPSGRRII